METSTPVAGQKEARISNKGIWAASGLLFLIGLVCWIMQLINGFESYSDQYAWGIYIAGFFSAVSAGAGAMIIAFIFSLRRISPVTLYVAALGSFVASGFLILADLGAPGAIFSLVFTTNFGSPMVMDFWALAVCTVFCLVGIFTSLSQKKEFTGIGLILAIALLGVEAWLIAASLVQKLWLITMGAAPAIIQALIAGFALALLIKAKDGEALRIGLGAALAVYLASILIDILAGLGEHGILGVQWQALSVSPFFWCGILIGVVFPLVMIVLKKDGIAVPIAALFGIFCTKLAYLWSGSAAPGLTVFEMETPHMSFLEIIIAVGFSALGVLVYQVLKKGVVKNG